jgi:hypothetical protein
LGGDNDNFIFHSNANVGNMPDVKPQHEFDVESSASVHSLHQFAPPDAIHALRNAVLDIDHAHAIAPPGVTANELQAHLQSFMHLL